MVHVGGRGAHGWAGLRAACGAGRAWGPRPHAVRLLALSSWRLGAPSPPPGGAGEERVAGPCPGILMPPNPLLPVQVDLSAHPPQQCPPGTEPRPWGRRGFRAEFLSDLGPAWHSPPQLPPEDDLRGIFLQHFLGFMECGAHSSSWQQLVGVQCPVLRGPRPGHGPCGGRGPPPQPPAERAQREGAQVGGQEWGGRGHQAWDREGLAEDISFVAVTGFQAAGKFCAAIAVRGQPACPQGKQGKWGWGVPGPAVQLPSLT